MKKFLFVVALFFSVTIVCSKPKTKWKKFAQLFSCCSDDDPREIIRSASSNQLKP